MTIKIKKIIVTSFLTNCYLLISENEAVIIDPGGGLEKILEEIKDAEANLNYIILTHFHFDHTFASLKLKQKTGAKILIHEAEKNFLSKFLKADDFLKEGEKIKIGDNLLEVLHAPGHTKGSICLAGQKVVFTGDTIFKNGYGRTDFPGGSQKELENSLEKLKKFLKPGTTVYPGHGEIFNIGDDFEIEG